MSARRESRLRGPLVNLATAAVALVLVCGVLELVARFLRGRPAEPVASLYTEFDPLLGWRHKKGARVSFPQGDYEINSLGLRDEERGYSTPAGGLRLMVLGDSFAEGFSVPFESSVAHVLESRLRSSCQADVIAAGTVGYSTDQEYLFYREEGRRYTPRLLLLFFYYNDIVYNARESVGRAPKPLLTFKGGTPRVKTSPLLEPAHEGADGSPSGSAALLWAGERLLSGAPRAYDLLARLRLWPPRGPLHAGAELLVYSRDPSSEVRDAWAQTVNVLRALRDEAAAHAARIVIVYVPSKMEVSDGDWGLTQLRYGVDERTWDRGQVARWLSDAGRALEVPVLDLTAALRRQERGPRASAYHARGGHWNAVGHATAALEVEGFLRQQALLPDCPLR
jgi:hypothetical protein